MSRTDRLDGLSNNGSKEQKDKESGELCRSFSSRVELQLLVATEARNLDNFALKSARMQCIEKHLVDGIKMVVLAAYIGVIHAISRFIELVIIDKVHHELMFKRIYSRFHVENNKDLVTNQRAEKVCRHPCLSKLVLEITGPNKAEWTSAKTKRLLNLKYQWIYPRWNPQKILPWHTNVFINKQGNL